MVKSGRTKRKRALRKHPQHDAEQADFLPHLFKYMRSHGWLNPHKLTARNFPKTGRGICSKQQIFHAGDELIRLPLSALITIATIENDDGFKSLFDAKKSKPETRISFQSLLAFYLLHHQHLGNDSPLCDYLLSLPKQFSSPLFCSVEEINYLPNAILQQTVELKRKARDNFNFLKSLLSNEHCACCGQCYFNEIFNLQSFCWAYFAVNSRSVYINSIQLKSIMPKERFFGSLLSDDTNMALAPFLDMFNHSNLVTTTAELERNPQSQQLDYVITLTSAIESFSTYSQLFISYGQHNNLKLLVDYGFTLSNNQYNYFVFDLYDIEMVVRLKLCPDILSKAKINFIKEHNLDDQMFVHPTEGISHNLHVVLYLLFRENRHFPNILSQVAFGNAWEGEDMMNETLILLKYRKDEYKEYIAQLEKLSSRTASAEVTLEYMRDSVKEISTYLEKIET